MTFAEAQSRIIELAVNWVLEEANPGTVRAIVHGSFTPGSQVTGVDTATPERARQLRTEQRKWISERDTACGLPAGSTAQADWIATLAQDQGKALCVYGSTLVRIEQLRK